MWRSGRGEAFGERENGKIWGAESEEGMVQDRTEKVGQGWIKIKCVEIISVAIKMGVRKYK